MLEPIAQQLAKHLIHHKLILATAESCTGGWVAKLMTDIAGSSAFFDRGFVTYTNEAKQEMLGVSTSTLKQFGAVSEATVIAMAEGALASSKANLSLAISGIAGPTGGSVEKPVGMVCFAWQQRNHQVKASTQYFSGSRKRVREQAVEYIMAQLLKLG